MNEVSVKVVNQYFRKTIPLMVENNIPITPPYYALWYTYTTEKQPQLNLRIADLKSRYGKISRQQCDELMQEFMSNEAEAKLLEMQANISNMVKTMGDSTENAMSNTDDLNESLSSDIATLASEARLLDVPAAKNLVRSAENFMRKTEAYRSKLEQQNAEIRALKAKIEEAEKQVFVDGLTNVFNRRKFNEDISIYTATKSDTCVVLVDIDHFKPFNDEYGHLVGDKVLQTVAQTIQKCCERTNGAQAYRFGGEEFAVLLPNFGIQNATQFANEIRVRISKLTLTNKKTGESLRSVTTSLGVAQFRPEDTIESFIERADERLYDAKSSGRNCVRPLLAS